MGNPQEGTLTANCTGLFENCIKWSFKADKANKLSQQILTTNTYGWIKTDKTRIDVKVTEDSTGKLQILPIKSFVDFVCQIEYTLLQINSNTIYTFALEWFGDKEVQLPKQLIPEILGSA